MALPLYCHNLDRRFVCLTTCSDVGMTGAGCLDLSLGFILVVQTCLRDSSNAVWHPDSTQVTGLLCRLWAAWGGCPPWSSWTWQDVWTSLMQARHALDIVRW